MILACVPSAKAEASIQFVGSTTASGTNTAYSMSLTSLTGGIGSAPAQNDIIIVTNTFNGIANGNPGVASVGYTEVADLYVNDTNDVNTSVSYIFATSTPATSVTCNPSANSASSSVCTAMVFRGVDRANPMDVTATTTASVQNNEDIDCPVITPVTTGAYVVCAGGAVGASVSAAFATISGYTHQYKQDDVGGAAASVVAYKAWTSGAENPAAFVLNMGTTAQNSWAAVTMALRPAAIYISGTLFSDEGVTAITAPKTIALAVGTGTSPNIYTMTSDTSGNWWFAIGTTTASSTRLLVWVDATSTERASLFTIATTTRGDIGGLSLYKDRVIVSYGTTTSTSTTLADLGFYDSDNDSDIRFNASSTLGTLNVFDGQELHVWTGKTMELTGSSTLTGNVHIATSSRLVGGATTTVVGNFNNTGGYTANGARYWSQVSSGGNFSGITYGNGLFVAVEYSGQVKTSPDGINWTARTVPANAWQSVTYGNGKFVAVADSGTYRVITSSDGITWATTTASSPYSWHGVTYGLGSGTTTPLFVAVGCGQSSCPDGLTSNLVMTSPDGINWTTRAAASSNPWLSVTYGNGKFVAVSWNGTNQVMTSTDGVTWSPQSEPVSSNWRIITYGLGSGTTTPLFVAVGGNGPTGGSIITSPDGISWTNRTMPRDIGVYGVTYGDGLIVAVGYSRYALVSTDGVNWKDFDMGYTDLYYGVGFGNGMFSAVGDNGNVSTSKTLLTMSSTSAQSLSGTLTATSSLGSVAFTGAGTKTFSNNASTTNFTINSGATVVAPAQLSISGNYANSGTFTAGSGTTTFNGTDIQTATGTMVGTSAFANLHFTEAGKKRFDSNASTTNFLVESNSGAVVIPSNLTVAGQYSTSPTSTVTGDATMWEGNDGTGIDGWYSITYANGLFVAVANDYGGGSIMTSPDGITWTPRTAPYPNLWTSVTYGNGLFVAVSGTTSTSTGVMTSSDGINWTASSSTAPINWRSVTYGNGTFVAVACGHTPASCDPTESSPVMTSPDGINWTARSVPLANKWVSVAYGNGKFVAVAEDNTGLDRVMVSSDNGATWSLQSAAEANEWSSVTYGNGLFVAVSLGGVYRVMTSPDGITWTGRAAAEANGWTSVTYGNGLFVATAGDGTNRLMTSPDGIVWTSHVTPEANLWRATAYGSGRFVSLASEGTGGNNRAMVALHGAITFSSASAQSISGSLTGTSSLRNVTFTGAGTKTLANNASTTNFTINTGATVVAPTYLSISGNYTNSGTFTAGTGTTTFNGTSMQTATGTMTGTSAFANLVITNTSGSGSSTLQSVRFGAVASTTDTLTMLASTSANFQASATSTFQNISLQGSAGQYVFLRSSIPGTRTSFYVPGTVKTASYVDVKDNSACPTTITPTNGVDSGNTLCWTFTAGGGGTSGLTISGILYSDEGITPITTTKTIKIAVGTSTPPTLYSTSTNASGAWSFTFATSSLATSTRIVVWVDADATTRGAFFTKSASTSASITSVPLYQNRVIVSHEATTSTSTTITDLGFYDNDDDTDIQYNATTTSAGLVINAGNELHVLAGKTFAPGGAVTIRGNAGSGTDGSLHLSATSTFQPGGVTSIAGNFTASSSATFTPNFSGIVFNATTTGKTLITPFSLGSTTFSSSGGGWTFATSASTTNLTIKTGATVVAPATTLAINGNYSNSGTFTNNAGTVNLGGSSWDVSQAVYTGKYKSVSAQDGGPQDIAFSPDGTKMYMAGNDNNNLYQYTLSTAWDVTTAVYSTSIASADATPVGITFSPDGTKMFETGWTNGAVYPYALSTPWDLSTAVLGTGRVFPEGIHGAVFSLDGTKMYTENYTNGTVIQYTLPTPWDVSVTTATTTKNISETGLLTGLFLSSDGTKMYVMGYETNQTIFQYALSTPGDVSSAQYTSFSKYVGGEDDFPISFTLSPDGTKMYMVDLSSPYNVYQYDLSAQTATGTMTGTSAFNNVTVTGTSTATFQTNASTSNLTINQGATLVAPASLTVGGNLTQNGTYDTGVGKWWTAGTSTVANNWTAIAYGNGMFVAVSQNCTSNCIMSSPDGVTWTARSAPVTDDWMDVTYGNGAFVAVGYTNQIIRSTDGISWADMGYLPASSATMRGINYVNGNFVVVGTSAAGGDTILTSPDGITWTSRYTSAGDAYLRSVTYGNGMYVATGAYNTIATSTDGINWTVGFGYFTSPNYSSDWRVTYGNGLFVANTVGDLAGYGYNTLATSPNGLTWTYYDTGALDSDSYGGAGVIFANGMFLRMEGYASGEILQSVDGVTWSSVSIPISGVEDIAYGNGKFVGVEWNVIPQQTMVSDSLLTMSSTSAQSLSGTLTGTSSLGNIVFTGASTKTFSNNASTTNLTINSGATVVAPAQLSVSGNYTNSGTFTAGSGTTTFNGTDMQTATGTMTGTSAFANLVITNTSGSGSSTLQSVRFGASASTTDTLTMLASTSANFQASATSTFPNISLQGSSGSPVYLRSSTNGTRFAFYVSGAQKVVTYVDVKDSSACPTTINVTSGTDSGNTLCWSFTAPGVSLSSASNQTFYYTQATTTMSTMTVTDTPGATVTAVNDIRIRIASTTVNMKWDTTDTTATFGGTASGKVTNPVSYENNGTTLVIPVSNNFSAGDTLTIDGLSFSQFLGVNSATVGLNMYLAGASDAVSDDADDKTIAISGLSTLANHTNGQVTDNINSTTEVGIPLFGFNFNSAGEDATVSSLTVRLKDVNGVVTSDLTNFALYRDNNANGTYEAGDTAVGGTPVVTISGETGTVVFSTSFTATSTAKNYLLIGSVDNVRVTEGFTVSLSATDITMAGVTSGLMTQTGSLTTVRHMKGGGGASAGGSHGAIGGAPPAGDGTRGGGGSGGGSGGVDPDSGTPIGNEDGFNAPSEQGSPQGGWTNGTNVYTSNGVYTTTSANGARHTYTTFNFNVPLNNTVVGVEVKVEASGSTAAGTISVGLSWNNGNSLTSLKTTGTLGLTDSVFLLGGPADTWGRSWSASEFANGSFAIEITGNTSSNTLSIDAIQTKVYHQSSGGGGGGGGAI